jgi:hypothetical protein
LLNLVRRVPKYVVVARRGSAFVDVSAIVVADFSPVRRWVRLRRRFGGAPLTQFPPQILQLVTRFIDRIASFRPSVDFVHRFAGPVSGNRGSGRDDADAVRSDAGPDLLNLGDGGAGRGAREGQQPDALLRRATAIFAVRFAQFAQEVADLFELTGRAAHQQALRFDIGIDARRLRVGLFAGAAKELIDCEHRHLRIDTR